MTMIKNQIKPIVRVLLLISALQQRDVQALADWTILTFIQADNNLASFALRNMQSMQNITENKSVNVLAHWNKPQYAHAARYEITTKKIIEHESFKPLVHHNNLKESICASMDWAINKYPARHYMLVLWNHGTGVLDRSLLCKDFYIKLHIPLMLGWLEIPGLDNDSDNRGILYSDSTKTYLNNQQLVAALQHITTKLGKKIDIIGMDACLMAMLEVGYQIKDYAHYMVASQNSEPGLGWHYEGFLQPLSQNTKNYNPKELSRLIVSAYKKLYDQKIPWYTQSVLDLTQIEKLKKTFNDICKLLLKCDSHNHPKTRKILTNTQEHVLKFDTKVFVDLGSFCTCMMQSVNALLLTEIKNPFQKNLKKLSYSLLCMNQEITDAVIAHETAPMFKAARGISLYFPTGFIHHSYEKTLFSQNTAWLKVLNQVLTIYVRPQINKGHNHGLL